MDKWTFGMCGARQIIGSGHLFAGSLSGIRFDLYGSATQLVPSWQLIHFYIHLLLFWRCPSVLEPSSPVVNPPFPSSHL